MFFRWQKHHDAMMFESGIVEGERGALAKSSFHNTENCHCDRGVLSYSSMLVVVCWKRGEKIMNYTYIVECKDGTLYTGWTNNLEKRIADHNSGKGAKYTRARKPVTLVYYETFEAKEEAMKREYAIKHMSRKEKEKLIEHFPIL